MAAAAHPEVVLERDVLGGPRPQRTPLTNSLTGLMIKRVYVLPVVLVLYLYGLPALSPTSIMFYSLDLC